MTRYPETSVFFRKLRWDYPRITHGTGCWVYDDSGTAYLDACGGAFVCSLGHGVAEIGDAMAAQARKLAYVSGMTLTAEVVEDFADALAELAPGDLDKVYPLSSGSDAIEAALKLARQYWAELGMPAKRNIVALSPSYHGNTLLALSASAREHYKAAYSGWLVDMIRVVGYDANALERAIAQSDPETIAAFILEPIGGSSSGALVPPTGYLARVREICDRYRVLMIADEILVGAGRTGTWSALDPDGVVPDIQVLGKGISAGFAPLAAVIAPARIVEVLAQGSGALNHAQTYSHHAVSCAAGLATLEFIRKHKLVERCARMGEKLHAKLAQVAGLPYVGAVRGRGLLAGVEFLEEPASNTPFPRSAHFAESLVKNALDLGLIVWPNVGHVNGVDGDLVMLAPPFVVTSDELDEIVSRLSAAIERTSKHLTVKA
jgi:adenosylmethionine-8-amino-7-oxononanoate aminotransferase